jgi:hypothetical protein
MDEWLIFQRVFAGKPKSRYAPKLGNHEDNMKNVPPEDLAALPRDGASQIDHYVYGQPKRDV